MTKPQIGRGPTVAPAVPVLQDQQEQAAARDFASTQPMARMDYWQLRQVAIAAQVSDTASLRAVKLVFVGDSITDFWLLGDDPWIPGRMHGRRVWDESFGGVVRRNLALNIGISGDRTEHLLFRILPQAQGGLGQLDPPELAPEFLLLMIGINNSFAPEMPVVDSVFEGVLAVMRAMHVRKPDARIVLQSILPTMERARDDTVVRPVNLRLAALAGSVEFAAFTIWLDLYPDFVNAEGNQDPRLFIDGIHPNEAGYHVWRDRLEPVLASARASER